MLNTGRVLSVLRDVNAGHFVTFWQVCRSQMPPAASLPDTCKDSDVLTRHPPQPQMMKAFLDKNGLKYADNYI